MENYRVIIYILCSAANWLIKSSHHDLNPKPKFSNFQNGWKVKLSSIKYHHHEYKFLSNHSALLNILLYLEFPRVMQYNDLNGKTINSNCYHLLAFIYDSPRRRIEANVMFKLLFTSNHVNNFRLANSCVSKKAGIITAQVKFWSKLKSQSKDLLRLVKEQ